MKILAFGEVMMRLMCEDHKMLTQTDIFYGQYTGTGVNICAGLYQMGEEVYLATTLPDHHVGKAAAAQLRKLGIQDTYVRYQGDHMGIYFLEQGIGNRASQVTYLNRKDSSFGKACAQDYDFDAMLDGMDALHLCGIVLAMSEETRNCAMELAKKAKEKGVKIFFDCNYRPSLWIMQTQDPKDSYQQMAHYADVIFASYKDQELLGISMPNASAQEILTKIREQYHLDAIYGTNRIKDGYQGYEITKDGYVESEVYPLTIFDRIGGGDAFAAGAIYGYFHIKDAIKRVQFASVSGVLGHTTYGDSPVLDKAEIERYIVEGPCAILR